MIGKQYHWWLIHMYHIYIISSQHDDVIKWKHFPRYWPFVREFTGLRCSVFIVANLWALICFIVYTLEWRHNEHDGSQITGVSIVCSVGCSGADQRKHQSSASLAFVIVIHRWPVNSLNKGPVTRKMFPFDDVIMWKSPLWNQSQGTILGQHIHYICCSRERHKYNTGIRSWYYIECRLYSVW